jgi:predicted Zn-dependent peptidase
LRDAIRPEIERLKTEDITDDELAMIKTRSKADLLRTLGDNAGLAAQFATAQGVFGDWQEFFHEVQRMDQLQKADIRRVANQTFVDSNRVLGMIESTQMAGGRKEQQ